MLLDRGKLDRSGLDRSWLIGKIFTLYSTVGSGSGVIADLFVPIDLYATMGSESGIEADLQIATMLSATIGSGSGVIARLSVNTSTITLTFSGTLAAGKTVCIDGDKFTVLNDGVNAIADFSGDFPAIWPGTNTIIYEDSEGSRTVLVAVTKKDRSV